ncbi:hypothetical protein GCM10028773_15200 [Spirosoma koreense]
MKSLTKKRARVHPDPAAVRADILRSAVASFRIEKITISPEQAAAALRAAETKLEKSRR